MKRTELLCTLVLLSIFSLALVGCKGANEPDKQPEGASQANASEASTDQTEDPAEEEEIGAPQVFEINAENLLAAALPKSELDEGWIRLFDGQSLYGWFVVEKANWRISDGVIKVNRGDRSYLCTSLQMADYELKVDFRADPDTNSGIFLRTGPHPENVAQDCLELNIAPPDNPYPTGSFVERKKLEPSELGKFDPTVWHTYRVRLQGKHVEVFLDDKQILEMDDFESSPTGHISLQHNSGRAEFRNILMRPLDPQPLSTGEDWESDWEESSKEGAEFSVEGTDDGLKMVGGLGQVQSKEDFGNFMLQATYTLAKPEVNSGIFFRCVRDSMLDGYEFQVNHATQSGDPLRPGDAGAGAIFRRTDARIVMGDGTDATHITLLANGPRMMTWVNGVQVAEFADTREPNENPRRGLRLEPGPISLQGHDPTTEVTFHSISITEL